MPLIDTVFLIPAPPLQESPEFQPRPYCTISLTEPGFLQQHVKYHHWDEYYDVVRQVSSRYQSSKHLVLDCSLSDTPFQTLMRLTGHAKEAHLSAPPVKNNVYLISGKTCGITVTVRGSGLMSVSLRKTKTRFAHPEYTKPKSL